MVTEHVLALLIQERDRISRAIEALQGPKRRGRPPKNLVMQSPAPSKPGKRPWTAAQRKAQAERMKAYWTKKRKS
jgi:hypothetical protein